MPALLQRLCWNTKRWTAPSGGKFGTEASYPGRFGFGHEEWNFNTADEVDGYVYGYIYRDYESLGLGTSAGPHDFYFWARQNPSSPRLLVGVYHNAVFLPKKERQRVLTLFDSKGIFKRRAQELHDLHLPRAASMRIGNPLSHLRRQFLPALRVRTEDVDVPPTPTSLTNTFKGPPPPKLTRYYQFANLQVGTVRRVVAGACVTTPPPSMPGQRPRVDSYWRQTEAENTKIVKYEEILRRALERFLRARGDPPTLWMESGHTDVIAERDGHVCLMELKTCRHIPAKIASRAALGQLLYYAYHKKSGSRFAAGTPPDSLCVVIDKNPSYETRGWLRDISKRLQIDIDLVWMTGGKFAAAFGTTPFF